MEIIYDPAAIEKRSFEIIEELLGDSFRPGPERDVIARVVHATADPDFAAAVAFSDGAVEAGIKALVAGCAVITDVKMLKAGVTPHRPGSPGEVICNISDPDVVESAGKTGTTRATAAVRKAAGSGAVNGAIVAVGNAPTALYEIIRLVREEHVRPALIIGVPVGFVGAAESKEELTTVHEVPWITCRGRKGGSPVGAAIINALVKLANAR